MQADSAKNAPGVFQSTAHAPLIAHLLECSFSTFGKKGIRIPAHLHHFHQLDIILSGTVDIGCGQNAPLTARRGHALLLPPLCVHSYRAQGGFQQASFKFHLAPAHWARFGHTPLRAHLPPHLLRNLEDAAKNHHAQAPLCAEQNMATATLCLTALLRLRGAQETLVFRENILHPQLWPMLEEIEKAPFADWAVSDLARRVHLSPDHFSRCFIHLLQRTPQRYLLETRMKAAAAILLREPGRPVKHIAEHCGYASVHAFSRAFKSVFACGPAAYRHTPDDL